MAANRMRHANPRGSDSPESRSPSQALLRKRQRYTPLACDECKKRKVKCDGETPCQRCGRNSISCIYATGRSNMAARHQKDFKTLTDKIEQLQEQIDRIVSNDSLATSTSMQHPALATPQSTFGPAKTTTVHPLEREQQALDDETMLGRGRIARAKQSEFMGPTSSSFLLGVGTGSVERAGIHTQSSPSPVLEGVETPSTARNRVISHPRSVKNPLNNISRNEAFRLIDLYDESCGSIYPFIEKALICRAAQHFYDGVEMSSALPPAWISSEENTLSDGIWDILKLVIAIASVMKNLGPTDLSSELLESVESGFVGRLCGATVDILEIQAWTAMSILQFHCDKEVLAWRTIGFAGRAAIELGLHRCETYLTRFGNKEQRHVSNKLFWCIYVLDRRWSFGTGRSFAIPYHDIDPNLPPPDGFDSYLLSTMVTYAHVGSKVWKATTKAPSQPKAEKLSFLDFQVLQWERSIIPQLRLQSTDKNMLEGHSPIENTLRVFLYLHANQMRLFIFGRTLLSLNTINESLSHATRAVEGAKDSIRVLDRVNRTSNIYSAQQTSFNHFLVSALAVIFLAVCHAPSQFNDSCREEFFMALDLVRGFSSQSYIGKKLWRKIKHLKDIGPKLGILSYERHAGSQPGNLCPGTLSRVSSASAHIPCLSDPVEVSQQWTPSAAMLPPIDDPLDPHELSNELTTLFDSIQPAHRTPLAPDVDSGMIDVYNYGTTEDFSRRFLDLF